MKPYYSEPGIDIYLGNCHEIIKYLPKVDLVLTDPPYGLKEKIHDGGGWSTNPIYDDVLKWDVKPSYAEMELIRYMGKHSIIWGGNYYQFPPSRCWLVWSKINSVPTMADAELAWTNFDHNARVFRDIINADGKKF